MSCAPAQLSTGATVSGCEGRPHPGRATDGEVGSAVLHGTGVEPPGSAHGSTPTSESDRHATKPRKLAYWRCPRPERPSGLSVRDDHAPVTHVEVRDAWWNARSILAASAGRNEPPAARGDVGRPGTECTLMLKYTRDDYRRHSLDSSGQQVGRERGKVPGSGPGRAAAYTWCSYVAACGCIIRLPLPLRSLSASCHEILVVRPRRA